MLWFHRLRGRAVGSGLESTAPSTDLKELGEARAWRVLLVARAWLEVRRLVGRPDAVIRAVIKHALLVFGLRSLWG